MSSGSKAGFLISISKTVDEYLPDSFADLHTIIDDSALAQIFYTSCKNAPYSFLANEFGINNIAHALSSRVRYVEASVISLASMVHHLFFALFYTGLTLITGGFFQSIADSCIAHWTHVSYSAMSFMIGIVGIITPYWGTMACAGVAMYLYKSIEATYEKDRNGKEPGILREINKAIDNNWYDITQAVINWLKDDKRYNEIFRPAMELAKKKIEDAGRVEDVIAALWEAKSLLVDKNYEAVNKQENKALNNLEKKP